MGKKAKADALAQAVPTSIVNKDPHKQKVEAYTPLKEGWADVNLGLQQMAFHTHVSLRDLGWSTASLLCTGVVHYLRAKEDTQESNTHDMMIIGASIIVVEAILYGLEKLTVENIFHISNKEDPAEILLELKLVEELNAGKFLPLPAVPEEARIFQDVATFLYDTNGYIDTAKTIIQLMATVSTGALMWSIYQSLEQSNAVLGGLFRLIYPAVNRLRKQYEESQLLFKKDESSAITLFLSILKKYDLPCEAPERRFIYKAAGLTAERTLVLAFTLKFGHLDRKSILILRATDLLLAFGREAQQYFFLCGIPLKKMKAKQYEKYFEETLKRASAIGEAIESNLRHIGQLPHGWIAPHGHKEAVHCLLVNKDFFAGRDDFSPEQYVLKNDLYHIPLITPREGKSLEIISHMKEIKKLILGTRMRTASVESTASSHVCADNIPKNTEYYYPSVSEHVVLSLYNKQKRKAKKKSADTNMEDNALKNEYMMTTREITWGLAVDSPYLDETKYTLAPLETTSGDQVVSSHIWLAIPTPEFKKFEKYLTKLDGEWQGQGMVRFEAEGKDTNCYKTHDKTNMRYIALPAQLGEYQSGSSDDTSRPLLLRLHTEEWFSHRQLELQGLPGKFKPEVAAFHTRCEEYRLILKK